MVFFGRRVGRQSDKRGKGMLHNVGIDGTKEMVIFEEVLFLQVDSTSESTHCRIGAG